MVLCTAFTEMFSIEHPIALAPMGGSAGGALAAAVSNGGGLGLVGGGRGDAEWLETELAKVVAGTEKPWGVGFQSWAVDVEIVGRVLAHQPAAVMLSFGDPRPFVDVVRDAGARLIIQVTDIEEAEQAVDVGADVIVAQGRESGGHGSRTGRSTLSFVPVVVDLVAPMPVLAAGGIADGRGLAAALALGAAGGLIGTRFQATLEALIDPATAKSILEGRGDQTERSAVLDIVRNAMWPAKYDARTLRHPFLERWRGHEDELADDHDAKRAYLDAVADGQIPPSPVWASEAIDLINDLRPATDLVEALAAQAVEALAAQAVEALARAAG